MTDKQSTQPSSSRAVLASTLSDTHKTYLALLQPSTSSDLYKEAGRTVRCIAQCLADLGDPEPYDDAEFDDDGLNELDETEDGV